MIKQKTQERVNITVLNYLNIISIWKGKFSDPENPVLLYFINSLMVNDLEDPLKFFDDMKKISTPEFNDIFNMNISTNYFHDMVKEFYNIYKKLDDIYKEKNDMMMQMLIHMFGDNEKTEKYVDGVFKDYKNSFYELVRFYKSKDEEFNKIKINVINDKMFEYANKEEYEKAAELRDKIKKIKKENN